jgi:hypothetical protein
MKNDEDVLVLKTRDAEGGPAELGSGEEAAADDDVIELVNVLEPGKAPDSSETDLAMNTSPDRADAEDGTSRAEAAVEFDEPESGPGPEPLAERTVEGEMPEGGLALEEPAEETYEIELDSGADDRFDLKELDEKLQFSFAETEGAEDDGEPLDLKESDLVDTVLYDEDANVIGEVLQDEAPDDFEGELDSVLDSLELTDDEEKELDFLEADLDSLSDARAFDEPAFAAGGLEELGAGAAAGMAAGFGELGGGEGRIGPAGISDERLEAIITRVAEKVARDTMKEVAERVISQAINALKESLEASEE